MKKVFTLLLSVFIVTMVMGQAPQATIKKATVAPVIDGEIDDVWATAEPNLIDKSFKGENPTLGASGDTWWKALWTDNGVYVLVNVKDDIWAPAFGASNSYLYDKIEIYFDTNFNLKDGKGPLTDGNGQGNGHYQFAPDVVADSISGGYASSRGSNGARYSYNVKNPTYLAEFFIPFTKLLDENGSMVDKTAPIGFDVTVSDNDVPAPGGVRNRAVWANVGNVSESWNNMDDCGTIMLEGAVAGVDIESIVISGTQVINTDNGTVQLTAAVTPANATQTYKWVITGGTGMATISSTGLVKAVKNGTVTVRAETPDGFTQSNELTITISNQVLTYYELSYIKDGDFTEGAGTTPSAIWRGGAMVENGVLTITNPTAGANPWDYTISQTVNIPQEIKDSAFVLQLTAWAAEPREFDVDFENVGGDYIRFGDSPDATAIDGHSQWHLQLTTEPTVYKLHITNFSRMSDLPQVFNLFAGKATPKVFVDKVFLVTKGGYITSAKQLANSINRVYPNPVGNGNTLFIELSDINSKVAIYNAAGQKLTEKTVNGYKTSFDVSSLRQGLYFIKTSDGSVQKFVK